MRRNSVPCAVCGRVGQEGGTVILHDAYTHRLTTGRFVCFECRDENGDIDGLTVCSACGLTFETSDYRGLNIVDGEDGSERCLLCERVREEAAGDGGRAAQEGQAPTSGLTE